MKRDPYCVWLSKSPPSPSQRRILQTRKFPIIPADTMSEIFKDWYKKSSIKKIKNLETEIVDCTTVGDIVVISGNDFISNYLVKRLESLSRICLSPADGKSFYIYPQYSKNGDIERFTKEVLKRIRKELKITKSE